MKTKHAHKNYQQKINICPSSGKVGFNSESAASKKIGKYSEIVRYYLCPDPQCLKYHITHLSATEMLNRNTLGTEEENCLLKLQNAELLAEIKELKQKLSRHLTNNSK